MIARAIREHNGGRKTLDADVLNWVGREDLMERMPDGFDHWKTSEPASEFDDYEPKPEDPCACGHDHRWHKDGVCSAKPDGPCDCNVFELDERAFVREAIVRAANWEPWKD